MPSRRRVVGGPRSRWHWLSLVRLEDRLAPAVSIMGPHSKDQWLGLGQTAGTAWSALGQLPAAPAAQPVIEAPNAWHFTLNSNALDRKLADAPDEFAPGYRTGDFVVSLPRPDGTYQQFRVWEVAMMEPGLAAQFPGYKTYRGEGIDDPYATLAADTTALGFHAQVLSPDGAYYIDPYYHLDTSVYAAYYKGDAVNPHSFTCLVGAGQGDPGALSNPGGGCGCGCPSCQGAAAAAKWTTAVASSGSTSSGFSLFNSSNGLTLRTYRLAVAATAEYTAFFGGTVPQGQAAIVTAVNRVSGVYEAQLSVRMVLVANNSNLVYTDAGTDPYDNGNGGAMLGQNQTNIDSVIGSANYDIGHVFSTGGGGVAGLGVVGVTGQKARGVTGQNSPVGDPFYIDYVAHEMGHQYDGNHTFNGAAGSCGGNRNGSTAYEQGSGSTIMAYAGICGTDNLQPNSDPYFHWKSLDEISSYISVGAGIGNTQTPTGNNIPVVNAGGNFTIPALTPFALTGSATDADGDALTYLWEQADLGPASAISAPDNGTSPLFRSFNPTTSPTRTFPRLSNLLAGTNSVGEVYPSTNRSLNFRLTVFDNRSTGAFAFAANKLTVVNTGAAFAVTNPNTAVSWQGNSIQTITWNVAGTTGSGINAANVNILLSTDGGLTFPTTLAASTANDGSESVVLPNTPTGSARIKVQPVGNVFFDISDKNFTITTGSTMQVTGTSPAVGSLVVAPVTQLDVSFTAPVDVNSIGTNDLTLSVGTVTNAQLQGSQTVRYTLSGITAEGPLTATLPGGAVTDTSANPVGPFVGNYTVDIATVAFPTPLTAEAPLGSLAYSGSASATVNAAGDADAFTINLDAGQSVTALVTPAAGLRPSVTLTGPGGVNQTATATAAGSTALLQTVAADSAGVYTLSVTGAASTTGTFSLRVELNAAREAEANDTTATAQPLSGFTAIGGGAARTALRGQTETGSLANEAEPNNSTAAANEARYTFQTFTNNLYQTALTGTLGGSDVNDFFNIGQLQAGDVITVSQSGAFSGRGTLGDPLVALFRAGASATPVISDDDNGPHVTGAGDALIFRFTVTTTDTYYVRARDAQGLSGTYVLGLWLENTSTAPLTNGTLTGEGTAANGAISSAENAIGSWRAISHRSLVNGTNTAGDTDFFTYQFAAGDLVTVNINSTSTLDARVNLRNAAGTVVAFEDGTSTAPGLDSPLYAFRVPSAGLYYVEVLPAASTGAYTAEVYLTATVAPPPPLPGEDYYSLGLAAGQVLTLGLDNQGVGAINLTLVDAGGSLLAAGTAGSTNYDDVIRYTAPAAGTVFARVNGAGGVPYVLAAVTGGDLDVEANNDFAGAQPLSGNRAVGSVSGSDDWYLIPATAGQLLTLTTATPGDGPGEFVNSFDPVIELFDPSGVSVGTDDNSGGDGRNAVLTKSAAVTGNYRARVGGSGGSSGEYVLALAVSSDPPPSVVGTPTVNDGSVQRSRVTALTVTFSEVVTLGSGAFQVARTGPGTPAGNVAVSVDTSASSPTQTVAKLSYSGALSEGTSLIDGLYTLTVFASQVTDASAQPLSGGDYTFNLHRLFGDADGDRDVDVQDYGAFRGAFGTPSFTFDADGDGDVDAPDYGQFRQRFGTSI